MSTYPFYPYAKYTLGFKRLKNIRSKHLALLLHEGRVDFYFLGTGDVGNRITKKVFLKGKKYMEKCNKKYPSLFRNTMRTYLSLHTKFALEPVVQRKICTYS